MLKQVRKPRHENEHNAFFVVNPAAGKGRISSAISSIDRYFPGDRHEIYMLSSREDIAQVVSSVLKEDFNTIVAVGGDGTASSVASALVNTEAELGIIPLGTANMLARELGIPIATNDACSLIASPHENIHLDAMCVNHQPFIYQLVCGYSSMVMARLDPRYKRILGRSVFILSGLRHIIDIQPHDFQIEVDGIGYDFTATQLIVANAGILGTQPFRLGRAIKPDDGQLDLIVMKGKTAASFVAGGADIALGMDGFSRNVAHLVGRRILIKGDEVELKVDGETLGSIPAYIEVLPRAVRAIIPAKKCEAFPSCGAPVGRSLFRKYFSRKESAEGEIRTPVV